MVKEKGEKDRKYIGMMMMMMKVKTHSFEQIIRMGGWMDGFDQCRLGYDDIWQELTWG
jgi:hypothetical protein